MEIRDQFVEKCNSNKLRRHLLQESALTLTKVIEKANAIELADQQAKKISNEGSSSSTSDDHNEIISQMKQTPEARSRQWLPTQS